MTAGACQSRPVAEVTSTSLPSASASVHQVGDASRTIRPPAARAATTRASASSGGTQTSMWKRLRWGRGASMSWNQIDGPRQRGSNEVLVRAVGTSLVPEHGRPERDHVRADQSVDGHLDGLDQRRVGGEPLLAGQVRDPHRQLDVAGGHAHVVGRGGEQPDSDGVVPQVDVRMVRPGVADGRGDRLDEPGAGGERAGAEDRGGAVADNPPVAGAVVGVESTHGEGFGHGHSLGARGHRLAGPDVLGDVIILQQRAYLRADQACSHGYRLPPNHRGPATPPQGCREGQNTQKASR